MHVATRFFGETDVMIAVGPDAESARQALEDKIRSCMTEPPAPVTTGGTQRPFEDWFKQIEVAEMAASGMAGCFTHHENGA